jgi:PKD repeat protein
MGKKILIVLSFLVPLFCQAQLEFIENQGQWPVPYAFRAKLNHGDMWLKGQEVAFVLSDFGNPKGHAHHPGHAGDLDSARDHCYKMEFIGASASVRMLGEEKKEHYHNYFIGKDPANWKSGVSLFGKISQAGIYPGTDLIWKEEKGQLKYEFHLQAGADPNNIKTKYQGLDALYLDHGKLVLKTSLGTVTEQKPIAYQEGVEGRKRVPCRFKLLNNNTIGFEFPNGYDQRLPLVIDPVLVFSTFSGSRADNWGFSATYGESGSSYAGGIALGPRFPVTTGAIQSVFGGDSTVFNNRFSTFDIGILKFNSQGTQLLYCTYLGGAEAEVPSSMVVDKDNNLIILGSSSSANFPITPGAYDATYNGGSNVAPFGPGAASVRFRQGSDIILSKISPDGTQLLGSTFLGGSANDGLLTLLSPGNSLLVRNYGDSFRGEVAVDTLNRIYIASNTSSTNFPVVQPVQAAKSNGVDAVCARFNPSLTTLEFSTFLGGNQDDAAFSIQINHLNQIYLSGGTGSPNFPTSPGTIQPTFGGGGDGFVCRIIPGAPTGALRSTFLGTSSFDQSFFVQLDRNERVYLYGQTKGVWPVTSGVYANPNSGQFISCLSKNLDSLRFSTCFGTGDQNPNIAPTAFLVDDCGRIYCSGWGGNINATGDYDNGFTSGMPTTPDALIKNSDGSDFYMAVFEKNAITLNYATFFGDTLSSGSEHVDGGTSRFDKKGVVYQSVCAGCGGSSTFPTTPGVVSNLNRSTNCNNALFKYDFSAVKARFQPSAIQGCAPLSLTFSNLSLNGQIYRWNFQDGTSFDTTAEIVSHTFNEGGQFNVKLIAFNSDACPFIDSVEVPITVQKAPDFQGDSLAFCNTGDTLNLPALPAGPYQYQWSPSTYLNNPNIPNPTIISPVQSLVYSARVRTSLGCQSTNTFKLSNGILRAKAEADTLKGCPPLNLTFRNKSFQSQNSTWFWGNGDSTQSNANEVTYSFLNSGTFNVILRAKNDTTCEKEKRDTLVVQVQELPLFQDTTYRICQDGPFVLRSAGNIGKTFAWTPGQALSDSTLPFPIFQNPVPSVFSLAITDSNGCKASAKVQLKEGRMKADFSLGYSGLCVPANLLISNNSFNAQSALWFFENDSTQTGGLQSPSFQAVNAGIQVVKLKIKNDTTCKTEEEISKSVVLGGISAIAPVELSFCPGDTVELVGINSPGYQYSWPFQVLPQANGYTARYPTGLDSVTVVLNVRDSLNCPGSQSFNLFPNRPVAAFQTQSLADSCKDILNYRFVAQNIPNGNYNWTLKPNLNFEGEILNYTFPERGNYELQLVVSQENCKDTISQNITVNDKKVILVSGFSWEKELMGCNSVPILELRNESIGAKNYKWRWSGNTSEEVNPVIRVDKPQNLELTLEAINGTCLKSVSKTIDLQPIIPPSLITPNRDNKNETFQILNLPAKTSLQIQNRWGELLYSSSDYEGDWAPDGKEDVVFYSLKLENGKECRGWISIMK